MLYHRQPAPLLHGMTITTRHRTAARRRRARTRAALATRHQLPTSRYTAPFEALTQMRIR